MPECNLRALSAPCPHATAPPSRSKIPNSSARHAAAIQCPCHHQ
ncbi:MAG: Rieske 2Fe-2S domain-containing protein [Planctomycetes bacterium]|nr:Rieske 2Fe-2S domain-containing protein [Planctomycetota bacterium]